MRFTSLALGVGVVWAGAVACGGNSASRPAEEQPSAGAGVNQSGSASAGVAGKQGQGGAAGGGSPGTAGTGVTAGTGGQRPQSGCPGDLGSWTVETCFPLSAAPTQPPAGGAAAGGAAGEGGESGAAEPVCPPRSLPSAGPSPPPVLKGNQCCYYQTQICG